MSNDNFFRIVANSEPLEKGWLTTLRCGHKIKQDLSPATGLGVWCAECEVKGSKVKSAQQTEHTNSPVKTPEKPKRKHEKPAPAFERMKKAKDENTAWLFSHKDEFLAAVGKDVTLLEDSSLGCAGFCLRRENGFTLAFNPEVVNNLTDNQIYGIVGHEIGRAGGWCVLEAAKKASTEKTALLSSTE